jgi:alkyl sulfatase BDS1-like metallo-beta-lactamase superfamily hydrolase
LTKNPYDVERSWPDYFLEHRKLFEEENQRTYKCGELPVWTVHCPLGYIGNSTIIEGDDGLIVYDTGINAEAGAHIASEIKKISDKPIKAIFYSHHHPDHYNGTASIVDTADVESGNVTIYAWENFEAEKAMEFGDILPRQIMGVAYYGGPLLPPEEKHHHGIGLKTLGGTAAYIPPTKILSADTELKIAGVNLNVFYTGGEAISEFGIHIPEYDMVIIADEFFTGIPNTHTIRGSKPRMVENYTSALDQVRALKPEWLLGSHITPLQGKDKIYEDVTLYRDVTQYLWDQSIRLINKGYTPVELQHALKDLPDHLDHPPYSVPMYGTPFTAVPEYFTGWVSWFTGDATDLFPSEPTSKAKRLVELMGGVEKALDAAKAAHSDGDHQFAAELAQLAVRADPRSEDAKLIKAAALRARGYQELNPIARSWYLTGALELEGAFDPGEVLAGALELADTEQSASDIIGGWRYLLDAEAAGTTSLIIGFEITNTGERIAAELRNSVINVHENAIPNEADATVKLTLAELNALSTPTATVSALDGAEVSGDSSAPDRLLELLDRAPSPFYMHQR